MRLGRRLKTGLAAILQLAGSGVLENRWKNACAVFAFHRITDPQSKSTFPSSTQSLSRPLFDAFAGLIRDRYRPLSYPEFEEHLLAGRRFPRRSCLLTFDDGWRDNYEHAWPVLKKYDLPALIFLPTSFIGTERWFWQDKLYAAFQALREKRKQGPFYFEAHFLSDIVYDLLEDTRDQVWFYTREAVERIKRMDTGQAGLSLKCVSKYAFGENESPVAARAFLNREEVAEMAAAGTHFGSHSAHHRILPGLSNEELALETRQSRREVTALTGQETTAFSYPNGDFDDRVIREVRDAGYTTAFAIDYGTVDADSDHHVLRRIDMTEEMVSPNGGRFSRSLFAIETTPGMLAVKRRRRLATRPSGQKISRRIRLLYLIDEMQGEAGTEKQIVNLIRGLPPEKYEIHLACFVVSDWLRALNLPCRIYDLNAPSFWHPSAHINVFRFMCFLRREKIDILQTFFPAAHMVGVTSAFWTRVPRIITSRRNFGHALTTKQKWTMNFINRLTHRILANSFSVKQRTMELEGVGARQVDVIYNGVDAYPQDAAPSPADPTKADMQMADDQPLVGIVANLRPIKGMEYFVEAAGIVAKTHPQAHYAILGDGELHDQLKKQAAELDIADKVHFMGRTPHVFGYLRIFDIAVLSSLSEGFSNSILEYMAAGRPVVATDVGSNWETIENGVTGYLTRPQNPIDIAEKIIDLLDNPEKRKKMGEAGRIRIRQDFSMEKMVNRFDEYYRGILSIPYRRRPFEI